MNINGITSAPQFDLSKRSNSTTGTSSAFGDMLAGTQEASPQKTVSMGSGVFNFIRDGNRICSVTVKSGQTVNVEYTEDSTPEDPVVRIYGTSVSGEYDYVRRIKDINLLNATYPELCALRGYEQDMLRQQYGDEILLHPVSEGASVSNFDVLSLEEFLTIDGGDFSKSRNFVAEGIERYSYRGFTPSTGITCGEELLELFSEFIEESKQSKDENTEFDALMDAVDRMIYEQKQAAETRKEEAEKKEMERIFEAKEYERDLLLKQADEQKAALSGKYDPSDMN